MTIRNDHIARACAATCSGFGIGGLLSAQVAPEAPGDGLAVVVRGLRVARSPSAREVHVLRGQVRVMLLAGVWARVAGEQNLAAHRPKPPGWGPAVPGWVAGAVYISIIVCFLSLIHI